MKKLSKIGSLLALFIFLTTYAPSKFNINQNKKFFFFKIQNIEIINNRIIDKTKIYEKLNHIYGKNIIFIKRFDLEKPLQSTDFLEKIEVKKKYPNTILIKIFETKPIAIIYKNNAKFFVDNRSNLIAFKKGQFIDSLPNIFGKKSELNLVNFIKILDNNNFPKKDIKNYYYYQINRWDIELFNGQLIKFPHIKTYH